MGDFTTKDGTSYKHLIKRVRVVQKRWTPRCDVFDADTGEQLLNISRVELDITRDHPGVRLTISAELEYEGDAEIVEGASNG